MGVHVGKNTLLLSFKLASPISDTLTTNTLQNRVGTFDMVTASYYNHCLLQHLVSVTSLWALGKGEVITYNLAAKQYIHTMQLA